MESCWRRSLRYCRPVSRHRGFLTTAARFVGRSVRRRYPLFPEALQLRQWALLSPLPLIYSRWTIPRVVISLGSRRRMPISQSLVAIRGMEIKKLKSVRGKLHFKACNETFARRSPPFLCYETPPNAVATAFQIL